MLLMQKRHAHAVYSDLPMRQLGSRVGRRTDRALLCGNKPVGLVGKPKKRRRKHPVAHKLIVAQWYTKNIMKHITQVGSVHVSAESDAALPAQH